MSILTLGLGPHRPQTATPICDVDAAAEIDTGDFDAAVEVGDIAAAATVGDIAATGTVETTVDGDGTVGGPSADGEVC